MIITKLVLTIFTAIFLGSVIYTFTTKKEMEKKEISISFALMVYFTAMFYMIWA